MNIINEIIYGGKLISSFLGQPDTSAVENVIKEDTIKPK